MSQEERKLAAEHRDAHLDARAILATASGRRFFKYLFKNLDVGQLPELGLEGNFLHDKLGSIRAGNEIFKLIAEAHPELAGLLLAEVEKERYEQLYKEQNIDT